jgi:hypothetical protein
LEFDFFNRLKSGLWTKLPNDWLSNIRKKIQSAMDSSIKSIKLVRILGTANILPGNDEVKVLPAVNFRYIYQIYMEKSLFDVRYGQIIDHIGDEPWIRSELTCLCNISSHRQVMLTLGAKKKSKSFNSSSITSREGIDVGPNVDKHKIVSGDRVIVTNHGNLFPIGVVKAIDVVQKVAKIRWESSGKISSVELCNVLPYVIVPLYSRSDNTSSSQCSESNGLSNIL